MPSTALLNNIGDIKLQIIQGIANLEEEKNRDGLLILYGYVECLASKETTK